MRIFAEKDPFPAPMSCLAQSPSRRYATTATIERPWHRSRGSLLWIPNRPILSAPVSDRSFPAEASVSAPGYRPTHNPFPAPLIGRPAGLRPDHSLRIAFVSPGHSTDLRLTNSNECMMFTYGSLYEPPDILPRASCCVRSIHTLSVISKHNEVVGGSLFTIAQ
jgi:hypothetical protein